MEPRENRQKQEHCKNVNLGDRNRYLCCVEVADVMLMRGDLNSITDAIIHDMKQVDIIGLLITTFLVACGRLIGESMTSSWQNRSESNGQAYQTHPSLPERRGHDGSKVRFLL